MRYKSCRPAICVDAGGCHPAIAAMGYFRGVCPILEPGERITNAKGYVRRCILRHGPISIVFAMYFSGGTAVRGSPDFLMRNY